MCMCESLTRSLLPNVVFCTDVNSIDLINRSIWLHSSSSESPSNFGSVCHEIRAHDWFIMTCWLLLQSRSMQAKEYSGEFYMFKVVEQMVNATFHCQVLFMQVQICFSFGGSLSSGHEFLISLQAFHIAGLFPLQSFCKMKRKRRKKSAVEFHVKCFRG